MDTRTRLLDEGERLMKAGGYSGFSYADIAKVVEIRKASIHYHFASKADLAIAAVQRYSALTAQCLGEVGDTLDEAGHVRALGALFIAGYEGAGHGCLCGSLVADWGSLPEAVRTEVRDYWRLCTDWLQAGLQSQPNPEQLAETIFSMLEGGMLTARVRGSVAPMTRAIQGALGLLD